MVQMVIKADGEAHRTHVLKDDRFTITLIGMTGQSLQFGWFVQKTLRRGRDEVKLRRHLMLRDIMDKGFISEGGEYFVEPNASRDNVFEIPTISNTNVKVKGVAFPNKVITDKYAYAKWLEKAILRIDTYCDKVTKTAMDIVCETADILGYEIDW